MLKGASLFLYSSVRKEREIDGAALTERSLHKTRAKQHQPRVLITGFSMSNIAHALTSSLILFDASISLSTMRTCTNQYTLAKANICDVHDILHTLRTRPFRAIMLLLLLHTLCATRSIRTSQ